MMDSPVQKKKIRLGMDVRILSQTMNGVARCAIALLKSLHAKKQFEVYLFTDTPLREEYKQYFSPYKVVKLNNKRLKKYWKDWILPFYLLKYRIDLYHATWDKGIPIFSPCPTVMTIHDLYRISKSNKYLSRRKKISRFINLRLETSICKKIFAVSENVKKEIIKKLRINPRKIVVIYNDCDRAYIKKMIVTRNNTERYYKKLYRSEYFISIVGKLNDVRKNVAFLVRAFYKFIQQNESLNSRYKLVLIGDYDKRDDSYSRLISLINSYRLGENIILTGYVQDDILYNLLNSSKIMIFPSLFEGFGIPILEAFFLKIPVITSNSSAIPEVVDRNTALLINPASEEELANAISAICNDDQLRMRLIDSGVRRLDHFNWENSMDKILTAYNQVS